MSTHLNLSRWEADVILNDGGIATLRPARQSDREAIIEFYSRVSPKSKYLRFFSTHPTLSDDDLRQWLDIDYFDTVTLVLVERERIVATARYQIVEQFLPARVADVSFLVQDDHHGRGAGNILLEHLAQIGRECLVERFFAEVLVENRSMIQVFIRAGYEVKPELEDGFIVVDFPIDATQSSREVMERRELRAEANSIRRLLEPKSVAVVGSVADLQRVAPELLSARFAGQLHIVTHEGEDAVHLRSIVGDVDVVIVTYSSESMEGVLAAAAEKNAAGVIFMAQGPNPAVSESDAVRFVHKARSFGLRALGPAALGVINTDPAVRLNASPAPMPKAGSVGLFTQTAGIATLALSHALDRDCGLSSFISTGSFADVTANDVIQFWADDPRTSVALLSIDQIGNPRKFFRVLRRLALAKHAVVFVPSRALKSARHHHVTGLASASAHALDSVIRQTGAMVVSRRDTMYDIAKYLSMQPVPRGRRVTLISNSAGLNEQMRQSAIRFGLVPTPITVAGDPVQEISAATQRAVEAGDADVVLSGIVEINARVLEDFAVAMSGIHTQIPLVATMVGFRRPELPESVEFKVPFFPNYADALETVSLVVENAQLRAAARPHPDDEVACGDSAAVQAVVASVLDESPEGRWTTDEETAQILAAYGISLVPWIAVDSFEQAVEAAEGFGWDVVLKSVHPVVRGRPELNAVIRNIADADMLKIAWSSLENLATIFDLDSMLPVVQPTVSPGASLVVRAIEDPALGPMVSVGPSGIASSLLNDVSWRVPPLRRVDARSMLEGLQSAELLHGPTRLDSVEDVLMRIAALSDDIASIVEVELTPVIAGNRETSVVGARIRIAALAGERDPLARSL
ncbi:MAG: GNAT family N-acetyltransferase [Corynebacterium sp.]|uniref:GNAT family N-acetyltransferase n=1 Tax=Corynebacterium sp. TaxID=1720 RepID=UPI0026DD7D46|nr:GNAT family N-acetyltransferase [Corynebacterium sp.]MDO4760444.1 GNAT family N-acetyltransferase [Corynebacterium sp.]